MVRSSTLTTGYLARSERLSSRLAESLSERAPDRKILLATLTAEFLRREILQIGLSLGNHLTGCLYRLRRLAMGAADRLGHDPVDDPESQQVLGSDLHAVGGVLRPAGIPPQDRGSAF